MTNLRRRMLFDMQARNLADETQRSYIHCLAGYADQRNPINYLVHLF